jgi:conjugal transfer pilus assembly protein TraB
LDALASGAGRGNPEPVLFRIQDDAFLAGDARYRLSNCNGTAVGYGDLSTTRVKLQATRLVCVDLLENRLLEAEINGFITDSDGTLGMRGEVQNREGQIAGKALAASFAEGAAGILTAAGTTVSNANGVTQTTSALEGFSNGFASGTSNAAAMLAERYIEQMEAISPSITVEKGRRATLHFTEGMKLIWKEYQGAYIEKITPQI